MRTALAVLGLCAVAALAACSSSAYKPDTDDGGTIFMEACRPCHSGPSSPGGSLAGRNLTDPKVAGRLDSGGKGMPSFPGIKGQARTNLIRFVVRMSHPEDGAE